MANLGWFTTFARFFHQNCLEWPIWASFQIFQDFPTKVVQNGLKWLFDNFSQICPPKLFEMANLQLFKDFLTDVVQNASEWAIWAFFATFPIFFLQGGVK